MHDEGYTRIEKTIQPKWAIGNNELEDYIIPLAIVAATYVVNQMFSLPLGFIGLFLWLAWKSLKITRLLKKGKSRSIKQHYKYKYGFVKTKKIPESYIKEFNGQ